MESSASGSCKRARAPGNGTQTQVPCCLVDGCTADLAECRDYHRRHKVCELHSKSPKVTIQGREQRFCQQCSRFHSLGEFDEGKRSCRKRLDGHNRRRRKPQPDPLSVSSGVLFPVHQGAKFIPLGSHAFSASAVTPAWAGIVEAKTDVMLHNYHSQIDFSNRNLFHGSSSQNYKAGKQFLFLEGTNSTFPGASGCQALLSANSSSVNSDSNPIMFCDGSNRVSNSSCALSLLSSPQAETREIGLSHMVQTDSIPLAQPLIPSLNYSGLGMDGDPIGAALVTDSNSKGNLHGNDTFQIGTDGSSTIETHQKLSFSWD